MVAPVADEGGHWLSIEPGDDCADGLRAHAPARVPSLVVAHLEQERTRIFQFLLTGEVDVLRIAEQAQRLMLNGRLAAIEPVARQLAGSAADDPLAACLAGYSLLRLGHAADAGKVADAVIAVAPTISDGYILRGEAAAAGGQRCSVATGVYGRDREPAFRSSARGSRASWKGFARRISCHPRAAVVRHIFQRHLRGTMWSVFVPRPRNGKRRLEPGRLVITGADTGFEA